MPQFIIPWKSSAHRQAAIALYKAILSQCPQSGLNIVQQQQLSNVVRNRFRENRYTHSKPQLRILFKAGYSAIDHLDAAAAGSKSSRTYLIHLLMRTPPKAKLPSPRKAVPQQLVSIETVAKPKRSILDRPLPLSELSGRRRVPRLVNAGGVPMLRIKKPQPHHLSGYIRQRVVKKSNRFMRSRALQDDSVLAKSEDEWDDLIQEQQTGSPPEVRGPTWQYAFDEGVKFYDEAIEREMNQTMLMTQKMQQIVDEETMLAKKERADRLERWAAIKEGDLPTKLRKYLGDADTSQDTGTTIRKHFAGRDASQDSQGDKS